MDTRMSLDEALDAVDLAYARGLSDAYRLSSMLIDEGGDVRLPCSGASVSDLLRRTSENLRPVPA